MRQFVVIFLAAMLLVEASAQVTFSRDWNPGKRQAAQDIQCGQSGRSALNVCHMLVAELKQALACESRSILRSLQADEVEPNPSGGVFAAGR